MGTESKNHDRHRRKRGIKGKFIAYILPCVAAVLLFIILYSYQTATQLVNTSANARLKAESQAVTNDVSGWISEKLGMLEALRGVLENTSLTDEELMDYLVYTATLDEAIASGVYIGDAENNYIDPIWTPDAGFVPSERDWYKEGLQHDVVMLGVPYLDAQNGEFIVSATAKVANVLGRDAVMSSDISLQHCIYPKPFHSIRFWIQAIASWSIPLMVTP